MIGKLKRSLRERCPECGKILQIRIKQTNSIRKGMEIVIAEEYICCSDKNCYYERDIEQKRRRIQNNENLIE